MGTRLDGWCKLEGWELLDELKSRAGSLRCDQMLEEYESAQMQIERMEQAEYEGPAGERLTLWQEALKTAYRVRTGVEMDEG